MSKKVSVEKVEEVVEEFEGECPACGSKIKIKGDEVEIEVKGGITPFCYFHTTLTPELRFRCNCGRLLQVKV